MAHDIDVKRLKSELALRAWTQVDLAHAIGRPAGTLAGWLREAARPPPDLREQLERALQVAPGTLLARHDAAVET